MRRRFKARLSVTLFLIVLTVCIITAFQAYWLYKNYRDENRLFTTRTNILFRETIFRLQASRLKQDTNFHIRVQDPEGIISMSNVLQEKYRDTTGGKPKMRSASAMMISVKRDSVLDKKDIHLQYNIDKAGVAGDRVFGFLAGIDSLRDSITVKDIAARYRTVLEKEKINVPFDIKAIALPGKEKITDLFPHDIESGQVTIGFMNPVTYQLAFEQKGWYLLKRIGQPILISFLLLGVTIVSFVLLYRNLRQQQKLAQIKNDFIGNITHELKTPIATVSVAIEALRNFNALDDPRRTSEYLDISANELQRLGLLVDKVLKLSMFENKEIALNKEPFDIVQLAKEVMASMRLQFEKQHAVATLESTGDNFIITADKLHITSVLYNLFDNALKYSSSDPHITIHILDRQQFLEIRIADNGIGIAREY
ncbi:MAG TPA: HAMP domain-containing sensor histidine kinase, partial [Chitinophagaceae bacterium]|nr:HAMP domain-containing sensor histidine kinase [Chitinophagaceae bacterium]